MQNAESLFFHWAFVNTDTNNVTPSMRAPLYSCRRNFNTVHSSILSSAMFVRIPIESLCNQLISLAFSDS